MSIISYPPEIVSAKKKLERFDMTNGYKKLEYLKEFCEGIESINEFILSNTKSPFLGKLASLKRAHTRRLLIFIKWLNLNHIALDTDSFYFLFDLIRYRLDEDVEHVGKNTHELSGVVQQFFRSNLHILNQIIVELKRYV